MYMHIIKEGMEGNIGNFYGPGKCFTRHYAIRPDDPRVREYPWRWENTTKAIPLPEPPSRKRVIENSYFKWPTASSTAPIKSFVALSNTAMLFFVNFFGSSFDG